MKKQTKSKRTPPRRKPVRKAKVPRMQGMQHGSGITQEMRDEVEAYDRAMLERMTPEVREEYLHLKEIDDDNLPPRDDTRIDEILEEYDHYPPQEVMDRHLADIVREREQAAAQLPQQDEAAT